MVAVSQSSSNDASQLLARQAMAAPSSSSSSSSTSSYDHRWLLFLIPIILLFLGLIAAVWIILRRRRRAKRRKSVLRNRSLVVAEAEKEREREEKRLSRGNSLSSKLSRMASTKSNATRSNSQRGKGTSREGKEVGHGRFHSNSTQSHSTEMGGHAAREEVVPSMDEKDGSQAVDERGPSQRGESPHGVQLVDRELPQAPAGDIEREAEAEAVSASPSAHGRVKIADEAKPNRPNMSNRKELSVIGETGVGEEGVTRKESTRSHLERQGSQRSTSGPASSNSHYTQASGNPFASPTESSNGLYVESPATPITAATSEDHSNSHAGGGLGRKLSGVIRLRQPSPAGQRAKSPASPSPKLHRSDSRASRKSSIKSNRRTESPIPIPAPTLAGQGASPISGSWTYTPKASQWKSSSTDVPASPPPFASLDVVPPLVRIQSPSILGEGKGESEGDGEGEVLVGGAAGKPDHLSPSSSAVQLTRKTSTGVAGSRFVESFD